MCYLYSQHGQITMMIKFIIMILIMGVILTHKPAGCRDMLKLGSSVSWTEAMMKIAGTRDMDAGPLMEFFRPVIKYLEKENEGHRIGWDENCPGGN